MADPAYTPANTAHTSDHNPVAAIDYIPSRRLIIEAGKQARAEQEAPGTGIRASERPDATAKPKTDPPGGIFQ